MSRVTVTNPYDLLADENEDRTNVPKPVVKEAPKPAAAKPAAPKPAAPKPAAAKTAPKPAAPKTAAAPKTEQKAAPKPAEQKPQQAANQSAPRDSNQNLVEREKENRQRGGGADRHVRPRVAGARGEKQRVFDRKSGTGRAPTENKKGGGGKGNWGGEIDAREAAEVLKDEKPTAAEGEEKEGEPKAEGETKAEGEAKGEDKPAAPPAPEELSLDEYLAKQKQKKAPKVAELKPRTVTADDFSAAGLVPLQREDESAYVIKKEQKKKEPKTAAAAPAAKVDDADEKLKTDVLTGLFAQGSYRDREGRSDRGRGGFRGGRGGNRGGQGFRGDRPQQQQQQQQAQQASASTSSPNLASDFPSLKQ